MAHNLPRALHQAAGSMMMVDPGASGTITVDRQFAYVPLVSATAETRTLARPTRENIQVTLAHKTDGGDITLTVTGGFNEDGETSFTFSDGGQFATFVSVYTGSAYVWRKTADHNTGNIAAAALAILDGFSALTATVAEINQACDESANVETVAATNVLTAAESGKTCFLGHATEFDTKLPAPAAGLRFKFIVALAPESASYTITTNGTTQNVIHGTIGSAEDAAGASAATSGTPVDVITFADGKAQVGDWVEVICDGTFWYASGCCAQQDGITLA